MVISYQTFEPQRFHGYQKNINKINLIFNNMHVHINFDKIRHASIFLYFELHFSEHMFGRIYRIMVFMIRVNQICHAFKGMWIEMQNT